MNSEKEKNSVHFNLKKKNIIMSVKNKKPKAHPESVFLFLYFVSKNCL